jgi:DNA-binding MarR family transcriptional regulator
MLLRMAHQRAARALRQELGSLGLEGQHLGVLFALQHEGPQRQRDLTEYLGEDKSAIVRAMDLLEERGYAARRPDPADRRAYRIELTAEGRSILREAQRVADRVHREVTRGMSEQQIAQLTDLLSLVVGD